MERRSRQLGILEALEVTDRCAEPLREQRALQVSQEAYLMSPEALDMMDQAPERLSIDQEPHRSIQEVPPMSPEGLDQWAEPLRGESKSLTEASRGLGDPSRKSASRCSKVLSVTPSTGTSSIYFSHGLSDHFHSLQVAIQPKTDVLRHSQVTSQR